ncbi:hypothetical protein NGM37_33620, partial [Streptomyces sp. TRM76130]|nr:hypothetical protein [Streptomyces sp. TRM76130]
MGRIALSAASYALGGPLPPSVRQEVHDLDRRARQALAAPAVPPAAQQALRRVTTAARYALHVLDSAVSLQTRAGTRPTAEQIMVYAALALHFRRPPTAAETGAVMTVRHYLPEAVR